MPLMTDLDLVRLEPALFLDAGAAAMLVDEQDEATISSGTLTCSTARFESVGVSVEHVTTVGQHALEIRAVTSQTTLAVARPRVGETLSPAPDIAVAEPLRIRSFLPLIDQAGAWAVTALRLDVETPDDLLDGRLVLNLGDLQRLLALRVIAEAYALASAAAPEDASLAARAATAAQRAGEVRRQTALDLDLDGDGVADARRTFDLFIPARA